MKKGSSKKAGKKVVKQRNTHAWRLCPPGQHWRRTHALTVPPSKKNPKGGVTTRHGHCVFNPTHKDQLYPDEIQEIGTRNFSKVKEKPCPSDLGFKGKNKGNRYDDLIAGWTKYWNEVFKPDSDLDPNIVKALIATESGFNSGILANKKNKNSARGLMQITNDTRKILGDENGELKDHYLTLTRDELNDPSTNICAGIRWLFRKREVASSLLKRPATWEETVAEFKGTRKATKARASKLMEEFNKKLEVLKKCKKS